MTNWTITPGALHPDVPGLWFGVNGDEHGHGDPHDERHYSTQLSALNFLFGHKVKIGDTVTIAGDGPGMVLDLELVKDGLQFVHDVGGQRFYEVGGDDGLIEYLDRTLQPGDVLKYHHGN
jgi:hypothetical protein